MTEMFFWIGAFGLAVAALAPLVYLAFFKPQLGKKILLVASSAKIGSLLWPWSTYPAWKRYS